MLQTSASTPGRIDTRTNGGGKEKKKKVEYGIRPGAFQNIHFLYKLTPKLTTLSHFITAAVTET